MDVLKTMPDDIFTSTKVEWTWSGDPDGGLPECPECQCLIGGKRDHATGCPNWGMLPEHWREDYHE